ncbi:hypothetical protein D2E40_18835 [Mycobacteroides abscessus]|nr:hypothetical protein D2E40_18835 [Mycobacteroides abscessus]
MGSRRKLSLVHQESRQRRGHVSQMAACPRAADLADSYVGVDGAPELHGCQTPSIQKLGLHETR